MEWTDEMIRQCKKPTGKIGRIIAEEMNKCHYNLWKWGLRHIDIADRCSILDVGCGGGGAIMLLHTQSAHSRIYGIDFSDDMVSLSQEVNEELIKKSIVEIINGSVYDIPYSDETFDLITAFETDYFWSDMKSGLSEIFRVLRQGGIFLIVDEAYLHEFLKERNKQWAELMGVEFYTPEQYHRFLSDAGFMSPEIIEIPERNWITIISRKPQVITD